MANLFHACMGFLLRPLETIGLTGISLTSGDGAVHNGHPIVAAYAGDYLEQILVTCTKTGECPTCPALREEIGNPGFVGEPHELDPILDTLDSIVKAPRNLPRRVKLQESNQSRNPFGKISPFSTFTDLSHLTFFTSCIRETSST